MKDIIELINKEIVGLESALRLLDGKVISKPESKVIVRKGKTRPKYYLKQPDGKQIYVSYKKLPVIVDALQSEYDYNVAKIASKRLQDLKRFKNSILNYDPIGYFENLTIDRQKLITPIFESESQFIERWKKENLTGLNILGTGYDTKCGFKVRSKSEKIIADALLDNGIVFAYEKNIRLNNGRTFCPDFTIMDINNRRTIYWEHFGMMDATDYATSTINKIVNYQNNGLVIGDNFIWSNETSNSFNQRQVDRNIKWILEGGTWQGTQLFSENR